MMRTALPPFAALRAFDAVGRKGGIRKAAIELGISHAIVSRHLNALEQRLGVQLFNRQSGELTDVGEGYFRRISNAIGEIDSATLELTAGRSSTLVIWSSPGFALLWLTRRLAAFPTGRSRPVIDLRSTDNEPDLERGEADGDLRYWPDFGPDPRARGVHVLELARPSVFPVAAPGFVQSLKYRIETVSDIVRCPLIQEGGPAEWSAWFQAQDVLSEMPPPVARYGQAHLTVAAARAGQGIALSNDFLVGEDLAKRRLEIVRPLLAPTVSVSIGAYYFRCSLARVHDPALSRLERWLKAMVADYCSERSAG